MRNKFHFYSDPGHGWLKVSTAELRELGIADKITPYSYINGDSAYLEEDCDCSTFIDAWEKLTGRAWLADQNKIQHFCNGESSIRRYDSYHLITPAETEERARLIPPLLARFPHNVRMINSANLAQLRAWHVAYFAAAA